MWPYSTNAPKPSTTADLPPLMRCNLLAHPRLQAAVSATVHRPEVIARATSHLPPVRYRFLILPQDVDSTGVTNGSKPQIVNT